VKLALISGNANPALADAIARRLDIEPTRRVVARFPDSELHIEIQETVRDCDVYLVQPTSPPADAHLMELLMIADACRRAGAARVTAIVPYFAYARQDRRAKGREPVGARLVAELAGAARIDRIVAIDMHTTALEGVFPMPVEHLSAVDALAESVRRSIPGEGAVVMSPDLGAVKLAERYARHFGASLAVVHKTRLSGSEVKAVSVVGDVADRALVVVDDMISTAGTIEAAVKAAIAAGARPGPIVVATHGLLVGPALERLAPLGISRLVVTDSVARAGALARLPLEIVSIAPLLGEAIRRLHAGKSLSDLLVHA
jgi:ribose-phosphate pyrophosphokinase